MVYLLNALSDEIVISFVAAFLSLLIAVFITFRLVSKRAKIFTLAFKVLNDITCLGISILIWSYFPNKWIAFVLLVLNGFLYGTYRLFTSMNVSDKRFRLMILSFGKTHGEYAWFLLNLHKKIIVSIFLKLSIIFIISSILSIYQYNKDLGFFAILVGLVNSLLETD